MPRSEPVHRVPGLSGLLFFRRSARRVDNRRDQFSTRAPTSPSPRAQPRRTPIFSTSANDREPCRPAAHRRACAGFMDFSFFSLFCDHLNLDCLSTRKELSNEQDLRQAKRAPQFHAWKGTLPADCSLPGCLWVGQPVGDVLLSARTTRHRVHSGGRKFFRPLFRPAFARKQTPDLRNLRRRSGRIAREISQEENGVPLSTFAERPDNTAAHCYDVIHEKSMYGECNGINAALFSLDLTRRACPCAGVGALEGQGTRRSGSGWRVQAL